VNHHYRLFGISTVSNIPVPGLTAVAAADAELTLCFGCGPPAGERISGPEILKFTSTILLASGKPAFRIFDGVFGSGSGAHIVYEDGAEFWLDERGSKAWATWREPLTMADVAAYLLGPVFGLLLQRRGVTTLHASAVEVGGKAVLFAGDAGAGKSTTAAAMARRGHAVISDDIVPVVEHDGVPYVIPSYPCISLWPESVEILYGREKKLPAFSANFTKTQLVLGEGSWPYRASALPLACAFIFAARSSDAQAPAVEEMSLTDGLLALVANSYATCVLDGEKRASEFELFGRLMRTIRVRRLRPHEDPQLLERLCEVIESSCRAL